MISAASQTLADFVVSRVPLINKEQISFEHPRMQSKDTPTLNLYCYQVRSSRWGHFLGPQRCSRTAAIARLDFLSKRGASRWFDLTYLVSAFGHTTLAEQQLLSEVLAVFLDHCYLPEDLISPLLKGQGQLPIAISTEAVPDNLLLWQVLGTPLRLALHIKLTVPLNQLYRSQLHNQPSSYQPPDHQPPEHQPLSQHFELYGTA
ncbi:Pvc16 family protein [cf. Phormidesmis sp. LEGE 11477]|uniref:Pvc16 family protein n=1 Tax=cf. Phormidesmis sp. LEGE 11477 TaxID=1828680 RepID=UPI001880386D|nr:Pvc16 family protein [cf. Phormidesmis sp. LEGE 11477]MBE9062413.1 DUF4255 domain-containing protein [cf. Phormidesmis sp. LEGE 11477]